MQKGVIFVKKNLCILCLLVLCLTIFSGCICNHEWKAATCYAPQTCSKCLERIGSPTQHLYTQKIPTDIYLCSPATIKSPATYYYACKYCAEKGTIKYTYGDCLPSAWAQGFYIDKFGDKTDEWYICTSNAIEGTFCNTATTDSPLLVDVVVDCDGDVTFFLYEYAQEDNLVKNGSSQYSEYYRISIRDNTGTTIDVRGEIFPGSDRISIVDNDKATILNMMISVETMRFYIQKESSPATTYRFDLELEDFLYALNDAIE